jgi:hypothetical protein
MSADEMVPVASYVTYLERVKLLKDALTIQGGSIIGPNIAPIQYPVGDIVIAITSTAPVNRVEVDISSL